MNDITRRDILYHFAKLQIGKDVDNTVSDEFACAISVNKIVERCLGKPIGGGASTHYMYKALLWSPFWWKVSSFNPIKNPGDALPGDLVLSPSGYGNSKVIPNGHVGIISTDKKIMSNNSLTGLWEENYTLTTWYMRYVVKGGYPMYVYRIRG